MNLESSALLLATARWSLGRRVVLFQNKFLPGAVVGTSACMKKGIRACAFWVVETFLYFCLGDQTEAAISVAFGFRSF